MTQFNDLTGQKFGLWTVLERVSNSPGGRARWKCACECGLLGAAVISSHLTGGRSTNCGCRRSKLASEAAAKAATTHGKYGSKVYWAWKAMLSRCNNEGNDSYRHYGGRGISVCQEWHDFSAFYADMGDPPEGLSLDRIDVQLGYCKSNCKWSTVGEQAGNRTNTIRFKRGQEVKRLTELVKETGLSRDAILKNHKSMGWERT